MWIIELYFYIPSQVEGKTHIWFPPPQRTPTNPEYGISAVKHNLLDKMESLALNDVSAAVLPKTRSFLTPFFQDI